MRVFSHPSRDSKNDRIAICVHGLGRNSHDFDYIAQLVVKELDNTKVVCIDMPGRGQSDWLKKEKYSYPLYIDIMYSVFKALDNPIELDWIGTSMGGLLGMMIAAREDSPIRKMVLIDIGPFVPKIALRRIAGYIGSDPQFSSLDGLKGYFKNTYKQFGNLSEEDWDYMAKHFSRHIEKDGETLVGLHYDPTVFSVDDVSQIPDLDLWSLWDKISCEVLTVRGQLSDLLLSDTLEEMKVRGPKTKAVEFADCGHTPHLFYTDKCQPIVDFLTQ